MLLDEGGLQDRVARMETLLEEIEALKDPNAKAKAAEVVQVLLELYGEGLARMMEVVSEGEDGERIFEENGPDDFKGIDIMRTVRSFDPCLPCGVHMYLGKGKVLEKRHSPTLGLGIE